jgi:acetylornithine deacetylase/succinyl-diaminopimelate desuccinylase-like protein
MMSPLEALPAVLAQIDANLPQSLDRLFDFLRIQSISTDPAYREQCLESARFVAAELSAMGFETSIRPTQGHPVVVGSANGSGGSRGAPEVKITCADRDLHSGLFGGAAQNPLRVLARILADMHDENGRVTIPGFYAGVHDLSPEIKKDLAALDLKPEDLLGPVGLKVPAGESDRMVIEQIATRPTAEINGMVGGYTGEGAKTVIPAQATAKVSFRLVGEQDPEKIRDAFRSFVRERLPADANADFKNFGLAPATELPFDSPALARTREALSAEWGKKAVTVGEGGSIPIVADFKRVLGMDTIMVGFALDDDRVHSPNEKYDLTSFHKGTRSWARILAALAE